MPWAGARRTLCRMKRRFLLTSVFFGLLVLAVGGWIVQGVRWTVARPRRSAGAGRPDRAGYVTRVATS